MGFSDYYSPPSASWSAYNQWLAEQEAANQQQGAKGSNLGGLGQAFGTLGGLYIGKKMLEKSTYQKLAELLSGSGGAELGAAEIPSLGAANALTGAEAALAPSDAALASWGMGEGGAEALAAGAGNTTGSLGSTLAAASPYLGAAGAGLGAYGIYNATQMADKKKAALAGGLSGAGMGMGTAMLALGAANMWNPVGWGLLGGGALLGAGLGGALAHKSTKQHQAERWGALDEGSQLAYAMNHPEGDDGIWDTGKYAGQEWTFEKALDLAREDPKTFAGVLGNFQAGGPEWGGIAGDLRDEIVRRNVAANNYKSDHGDVLVGDEDLFRKIMGEVKGGGTTPVAPAVIPSTSPIAQSISNAVGAVAAGAPATGSLYTRPANLSGSSIAQALGDAVGGVAASKPDYAKLVAEGKYRKGSKDAGGYVNNETNEWVAG